MFIHPSELFGLFAEVCLALLGFQVVATAIGRRVSGNWTVEDKERFQLMVLAGIQGLSFSLFPFFIFTNHDVSVVDWGVLYAYSFWYYAAFLVFYFKKFSNFLQMPEMDNNIVRALYFYSLLPCLGYLLWYLGLIDHVLDRVYYGMICHLLVASFIGFMRLFKYQ